MRQPPFLHLTFNHTLIHAFTLLFPLHPLYLSIHPSTVPWESVVICYWETWRRLDEELHTISTDMEITAKGETGTNRAGDGRWWPVLHHSPCAFAKEALSVFPHLQSFRKSCLGFTAHILATFSMRFLVLPLRIHYPSGLGLHSVLVCSTLFEVACVSLSLHHWLMNFLRSW